MQLIIDVINHQHIMANCQKSQSRIRPNGPKKLGVSQASDDVLVAERLLESSSATPNRPTIHPRSHSSPAGCNSGSSSSKLRNNKGLEKLGVSQDDVHFAEQLMKPRRRAQSCCCRSSTHHYSRYSPKALKVLGTSEEEVELENAKVLGSLGVAGRRRSINVKEIDIPPRPNEANGCTSSKIATPPPPPRKKRVRRTMSDLRENVQNKTMLARVYLSLKIGRDGYSMSSFEGSPFYFLG